MNSGKHETVMAVVTLNKQTKTTYCTFDTSMRSCS